MTNIIMDEYILPTLVRYIDHYHWTLNTATKLINMYYGTEYTKKELRAMYRKTRNVP